MQTFAVLQASIEPPPVDSLRRAFTGLTGFTAADAHIVANDAFGILVKNLDAGRAAAFQRALAAQGIATELAPMSELPPMPPGKVVRRVDPLPDALRLFDPIGRSFPVEWKHVMLVAAGSVRVQEFVSKTKTVERNPWTAPRNARTGMEFPEPPLTETIRREETTTKTQLEIVLTRGVQRYTLELGRASFAYIGDAAGTEPVNNFATLVRDILRHAPHALPNRGAFLLRREPPEVFAYPSRNAFHEEIVWMLWKLKSAGR
jgi:hypothetical protein